MFTQFVGAAHHGAVETLLASLAEAQRDQSTHVVLLRGASGVGKSRIVKEFYERLRSQHDDMYWPALSEWGHVDADDPLQGRKLLAPPTDGFSWVPHALPTFTWWAFECHRNEAGDVLEVVNQAGPSIATHAIPASLAVRRTKGAPRATFDSAVEHIRDAVSDAKGDLALEAITALGVSVPGLSWIVDGAVRGTAAWKAHREERQALHGEVDQGSVARAHRDTAVRKYAEVITATTAPGLPCVIVVEDLHLLGAELRQLIGEVVAAASGPVLVIGTVWPERRTEERLVALESDLRDLGASLKEVPIDSLENEHLRAWVLALAPDTDGAIVDRLVAQYSSPLAMRLFLGLKRTRQAVVAGALDMTVEDIDNLPKKLEQLYQLRWAELPEDVQQALALAAGVLPAQQLDVIGQVVGEAAARVAVSEDEIDDVTRALRESAPKLEWMTVASSDRQAFREEILRDIALLNIGEYVQRSRLARLGQAAEDILERRLAEASASNEMSLVAVGEDAELLSRWLLNFTDPAPNEPLTLGRAVAVITLADHMAAADRPRAALQTVARYPGWEAPFDRSETRYWFVRSEVAKWSGEAGKFTEAIELFAENAAACAELLGPLDPETVYARRMRSHYLQESGELDEAISAAEQLLAELREAPEGHENAITTLRQNLVGYLGESGQDAAAAERWEELIAEARDAGLEGEVRRLRRNQAHNLSRAGEHDLAKQQLEELLVAYDGDGDVDTVESLRVQMDLATWRAKVAAEQPSAIALARRAVETGSERWGSTSELGLWLRGNEAAVLIDTAAAPGDFRGLLDRLRVLAADQKRVGQQSPDSIGWVMTLALRCAVGAGLLDEAVDIGTEAHERRVAELGRDDYRTHNTANLLAMALIRAGRHAEALELLNAYSALSESASESRATVLQLRAQHAAALLESGRIEAAREAAAQLLPLMEEHNPSNADYVRGVLRRSRPRTHRPGDTDGQPPST